MNLQKNFSQIENLSSSFYFNLNNFELNNSMFQKILQNVSEFIFKIREDSKSKSIFFQKKQCIKWNFFVSINNLNEFANFECTWNTIH